MIEKGGVSKMRGAPRPEMKKGSLVIDPNLRPGIIADDDIVHPIRKIRLDGCIVEVWAADLVIVDEKEFEKALVLREMER